MGKHEQTCHTENRRIESRRHSQHVCPAGGSLQNSRPAPPPQTPPPTLVIAKGGEAEIPCGSASTRLGSTVMCFSRYTARSTSVSTGVGIRPWVRAETKLTTGSNEGSSKIKGHVTKLFLNGPASEFLNFYYSSFVGYRFVHFSTPFIFFYFLGGIVSRPSEIWHVGMVSDFEFHSIPRYLNFNDYFRYFWNIL